MGTSDSFVIETAGCTGRINCTRPNAFINIAVVTEKPVAAGVQPLLLLRFASDDHGPAAGAAILLQTAVEITAVVATSDVLALATLDHARARGINVSRDLSVIGFDDVAEAAHAAPPLTTIAQPTVERGRLAARMILDPSLRQKEIMSLKLIVRSSTGPVRRKTQGSSVQRLD